MEEWRTASDFLPPESEIVVMVKRKDGKESKAKYYRTPIAYIGRNFNGRYSRFLCLKSREFLHDVTHWKYL